MMPGFIIKRLALEGADVPPAEIQLTLGLNVISGPSDTGKTFIVQCLDFMFGSKGKPKEIPESNGYENVVLEVEPRSAEHHFTLERSLKGGGFRLLVDGVERKLKRKHSAESDDNISQFLLWHSGLKGKRVRKNKRGETRSLSFRDIARLVLVDEESVIKEGSPILTGQYTSATPEKAAFRLLLTGEDDSSVVVVESDPKIKKGRTEGRQEIVRAMLESNQHKIAEFGWDQSKSTLLARLEETEASHRDCSRVLSATRSSLSTLAQERRAVWAILRETDSRLGVLTELEKRFWLLRDQYASDLARLEATAETGTLLGEMPEEPCPTCGAPAEHQEYYTEGKKPEDVAAACRVEATKIQSLSVGLSTTIKENSAEISELREQKGIQEAQLTEIDKRIGEEMQPQIEMAASSLSAISSQKGSLLRILELIEQREELEQLIEPPTTSAKPGSADEVSEALRANTMARLCTYVEDILRSWSFPGLERVSFSETDWDIIISGRRRGSHGKGVRALLHSAFSLGLLRFCSSAQLPHPGLVVIDSPLVVYRQPDAGEADFSGDVKSAFYRGAAKAFNDCQVIVVENEDPPEDLEATARIIRFTGTQQGRRGFIPERPNVE